MKRFIFKYHLEIFTVIVLIFTVIDLILFFSVSVNRKLINLFMILGVLHEWEEKRFPGGFHQLMGKKFGWDLEKADFDKAGVCVITYWLVVTIIPYIFDDVVCLLIISVALSVLEAFVHTMGIFLHKMKKPYTPGLVSAWLMFVASIYTVYYLQTNGLATPVDYVLGTVLMIAGFALMDIGVLNAFNTTLPEMMKNMRSNLTKK